MKISIYEKLLWITLFDIKWLHFALINMKFIIYYISNVTLLNYLCERWELI
jgi:hypothetical protein